MNAYVAPLSWKCQWSLALLIKSRFPPLSCHAIVFIEHLYKTVITGN